MSDASAKIFELCRYPLDEHEVVNRRTPPQRTSAARCRTSSRAAQAALGGILDPTVPTLCRQAVQAVQGLSLRCDDEGRPQAGLHQQLGLPVVPERILIHTARRARQPLGVRPIPSRLRRTPKEHLESQRMLLG